MIWYNWRVVIEDRSMFQALVMTIAAQVCTEVTIRDIDDVTIAFRFKTEDGVNTFVEAIASYEGMLSFSRLELDVLVTFPED
jgi:hypothetical protein